MKTAKKYTVRCANCETPLTVEVNRSLKNHEKPVAFCSVDCYLKFKLKPRRGGKK